LLCERSSLLRSLLVLRC
nr:immunoglobulin heavy chain junction region [Mus musculus]